MRFIQRLCYVFLPLHDIRYVYVGIYCSDRFNIDIDNNRQRQSTFYVSVSLFLRCCFIYILDCRRYCRRQLVVDYEWEGVERERVGEILDIEEVDCIGRLRELVREKE